MADINTVAIAAGSLTANGIMGVFSLFLLRGHNQLQNGMQHLAADQAKRITELEARERTQAEMMWKLQSDLASETALREECQSRLSRLENALIIDKNLAK